MAIMSRVALQKSDIQISAHITRNVFAENIYAQLFERRTILQHVPMVDLSDNEFWVVACAQTFARSRIALGEALARKRLRGAAERHKRPICESDAVAGDRVGRGVHRDIEHTRSHSRVKPKSDISVSTYHDFDTRSP